jgi:hypothetical protein
MFLLGYPLGQVLEYRPFLTALAVMAVASLEGMIDIGLIRPMKSLAPKTLSGRMRVFRLHHRGGGIMRACLFTSWSRPIQQV